jgi:NitT/TauT family transport system substrate-binding protein
LLAVCDWDQTLALLKQYRDVQTDKPWTAFHTNEFLPAQSN